MANMPPLPSPPPRISRWRIFILCLAAIETLACLGVIVFLLAAMGSDPLGRNIAQGVSRVFAVYLFCGALPALIFAWLGRFMIAASALALGAPLMLLTVWARL